MRQLESSPLLAWLCCPHAQGRGVGCPLGDACSPSCTCSLGQAHRDSGHALPKTTQPLPVLSVETINPFPGRSFGYHCVRPSEFHRVKINTFTVLSHPHNMLLGISRFFSRFDVYLSWGAFKNPTVLNNWFFINPAPREAVGFADYPER